MKPHQTTHHYLDYAARAVVRPEVLIAQRHAATYDANPESLHTPGRNARAVWDEALQNIARTLSCQNDELVLTADATESAFLALAGIAAGIRAAAQIPFSAAISTIEHPAVSEAATALETNGVPIQRIHVDHTGTILASELSACLRPDTRLVSLIAASNIVGTVQPLRRLISEIRAYEHAIGHRIYVHTDASQLAPWARLLPHELDVDALTLSGAKLGTSSNIGFLYLKAGTPFVSPMIGGGQQYGRRGGTLPVVAAAELAAALTVAWRALPADAHRIRTYRDQLEQCLHRAFPKGTVHDAPERLPNLTSFTLPNLDAEAAVYALDAAGIACSAGSACVARTPTLRGRELRAMGRSTAEADGTLRLSFGWASTEADVRAACSVLPTVLTELQDQSRVRTALKRAGTALARTYATHDEQRSDFHAEA